MRENCRRTSCYVDDCTVHTVYKRFIKNHGAYVFLSGLGLRIAGGGSGHGWIFPVIDRVKRAQRDRVDLHWKCLFMHAQNGQKASRYYRLYRRQFLRSRMALRLVVTTLVYLQLALSP